MNHRLENEKVSSLLFSLALPSILAQLATLIYNMVDRIYIGRLPDGGLSIAGIGLCTSIITIITAFSNLFGRGGAPLASIKLGEKNPKEAERILGNAFSSLILTSLIIMFCLFVWGDKILILFGASQKTLPYALSYLRIYAVGTVFIQLTVGLNYFINTQGYAKFGMMTLLIGGILNISQFVSCIWVLSFLFGKKTIIKIRKEYLLFDKNIMKKILGLGFTPFFMSSTEGILQVAFNRQLLLYGGDLSVSAMTILLSMSQILSLPMEGIAQGAQPIISYNFGAKKYDRVKETIKITIKVALTYSIIGVLLMEAFPQVFVSLFANNTQLIQLSYQLLRIYIFGFIIMGAFSTFQQTYNALGCGKNAFFFAFFRKIILLIPLIYLLPFILPSYGVYAVVLAEPISDLMTTILNGIYFKHFVKKTLA